MDEKVNILCVDDEPNVLRSLQRVFFDTDYDIFVAESGPEGLEILKKTDPIQIIISDYRMPEMNGIDFLRQVRAQWEDTIRIVLSGYADMATIISAINEGQIYKFIPKPWNDDELKLAIFTAVEKYNLQKQNKYLAAELTKKNEELQKYNDTLEDRVRQRTAELEFQYKALLFSQNILDALPVAVIGIDMDGFVVQANQKGNQFFNLGVSNILGLDRGSFPDEINQIIDEVIEKTSVCIDTRQADRKIRVNGILMHNDSGQEGIILTLDEVK